MLHVRIDDETKLQAQQALKSMGLSVSDAVRIFLTRVVAEQAIPFDVRVPNTTTVAAMINFLDLKNAILTFSTF
jgi:DNA-damage-inducible protein J